MQMLNSNIMIVFRRDETTQSAVCCRNILRWATGKRPLFWHVLIHLVVKLLRVCRCFGKAERCSFVQWTYQARMVCSCVVCWPPWVKTRSENNFLMNAIFVASFGCIQINRVAALSFWITGKPVCRERICYILLKFSNKYRNQPTSGITPTWTFTDGMVGVGRVNSLRLCPDRCSVE